VSITLYYSPGSCSLAVHIALHETGEPFEIRKFATAEKANYSPEYLAVNPKARIPALMIDGFTLTEMPAILAYIGRRFPAANLYPTGPGEAEARCLELLAWSSNTVHVAFAQLMRPERFVLREESYPPVKESGQTNFGRCLTEIEKRLQEHQYAIGPQFTVVDPFWLVFFRWGARSGYDMRAKFPAYSAYAERLCSRASVQRTLSVERISVWQ
jgi:glutathione S-transferase